MSESSTRNSAVIQLHIQPGAKRTCVKGKHGDRIKIAIAAPPTDGRANKALLDFLAEELNLPKHLVELVSGESSRLKAVRVFGLATSEVERRLHAASTAKSSKR